MATRTERLKQLLDLQERLKQMHEMRRAGHLAAAASAARDASEILQRRTGEGSLSDLFPDVYARFVDRAIESQRESEAKAADEAGKVAVQTARAKMIERAWLEERRAEERKQEEKAALETVERNLQID